MFQETSRVIPPQALDPSRHGLIVHTRGGEEGAMDLEISEKPVILPAPDNDDPAVHAWADARFAVDIMAEHALFFTLLMPPETCAREHAEAQQFLKTFGDLFEEINSAPPPAAAELRAFATNVIEKIAPFIAYKARMGDAQRNGSLRSLVWPLFFEHTRHEAERWSRRLTQLAEGASPDFDRDEVAAFWTDIMDEHARFVAHLLDPEEFDLIDTAYRTGRVFAELHKGGLSGVTSALVREPATVAGSLMQNPETDAILSAAETILDFKTKAARDIEAARIKSIIDPALADHVRREAVKFIDELKRAV